jgi:hypothetical protein
VYEGSNNMKSCFLYMFIFTFIDKFTSLREQLNEFGGFVVGLMRGHSQKGRQSYRNPFDIPRHCLLDQAVRMRANFLQPALAHTKLIDDGKCLSHVGF